MKRFLGSFVLFLSIILGILCARAFGQSPFEAVIADIGTHTAGLTYISEADAPLTAFFRNQTVNANTPEILLQLLRLPASTYLFEITVNLFFDRLIDGDASGRFELLRDFMLGNLANFKVYKIPRPANNNEIDIYVVGLFSNKFVGFQTFAIET